MDTVAESHNLENLHPSLWRASQLARSTTRCVDTGHMALSNQLVGGGWPTGQLIELMVQQPGAGEMRLLAPALAKVAHRKVVFIEPPHPPHAIALAGLGIGVSDVLWVKSKVGADALWATEQVLRSASCGAVLLWSNHLRQESLRRLHLAAQSGETLLYIVRPLAAAQDASPSPLRLSIRPAAGGVNIGFIKRRGPQRDEALFLPLGGPVTGSPRRQAGVPDRPANVPVTVEQKLDSVRVQPLNNVQHV
jgi:protein ImuA